MICQNKTQHIILLYKSLILWEQLENNILFILGFGKSDKYTSARNYTHELHTMVLRMLIEELNLQVFKNSKPVYISIKILRTLLKYVIHTKKSFFLK